MHVMRTSWLVALLVVPALAIAGGRGAVATGDGPVVGTLAGGVESFKGIPYARPPVGELRWRAPQAPEPWSEPLRADHYGHDCMQLPFPSDAAPLGTTPDEDCLVLNVWRPAARSRALRPVVFWIYGGGFVNGGSSPAVYDGSAFARAGLVFVSFNYRLGRFGFFAHPQLSAARPAGEPLGNYGYMDQVAALRWVHRNIAAFGGDPDNVTVIGESAGGGSVHMLLTYRGVAGLFRNAVVMSGGGRGSLMGRRLLDRTDAGNPSAEQAGLNFARSAGIAADDPQALEKLRALPAERLVDGLNLATLMSGDRAAPTQTGPFIDGQLVTDDPDALYARGQFNRVRLMVGATSADIGFSAARSRDEVFAPFGAARAEAERAYDPAGTAEPRVVGAAIARNGLMIEPARHVARLFAGQGVPAYLYRFSYVASSMAGEWREGAPHATDIPYFLDTVSAKYGKATSARDRRAGQAAFRALVAFARTGRPSGPGLPPWPASTADDVRLMDFNAGGGATYSVDPLRAQLDATAAAAGPP